ncbi:cell division protein FtsZ, partial [Escherichia coli]
TDVVNQIVDLDEGQVFYGTVFDPDARDEISVTVIATGLTRHAADSVEPTKRTNVQQATRPAATAQAVVEDDDVPAIQRQQHETGAAANPAAASVS